MQADDAERGSASVEIVLLTPLLVVLVGVAFFAGRLALARQVVDDAARSALQAAVMTPDKWDAAAMAKSTAREVLGSAGLCSTEGTDNDTARFTAGGTVSVTVTCTVRLPTLAFLQLPESVDVTATRSGPLEPYREIGP